ncbi:MAG: uroporphyrinogen decarboxylase family protein, partial [Gemmatimonadota bacterium]
GFSSWAGSIVLGREAYVGGGIQQWRESAALWDGEDAHAEFLERSRRDTLDLTEVLDQDLVRVLYWRMPTRPARKVDGNTYLYGDPEGEWQVMRFDPATELYQVVDRAPRPRQTADDLEREVEAEERGLERPPPGPEAYAAEVDAMAAFPNRAVRGRGAGINIDYRRPEWLEAIALRVDLVERHLEVQKQQALRSLPPQADLGLRLLAGGGDFASNQGPFYSPAFFHAAVMPRLRQVTEAYEARGCYLLYASDGNLWPVADDLFGAAGVHGYYEVDLRAGMDLRRLRERFPELTLLGGISSHTLHTGTRDEVVAETRAAMEAAAELGSVLVGCSNQIVAGTPPASIEAMVETIDRMRPI